MPLQSTGPISLNDIHIEAGGTSGTTASLNDADIRGLIGKSTSTTMSFNEWYGASNTVSLTYEIIGGGGGGGSGWTTANNGTSGGASTLSGTGFTTVTSPGGAGGRGGIQTGWGDGSSSYYGAGGAGGANSDSGNQTAGSPAPTTSYGAGGGGGGAGPFSGRNGGEGGYAGGQQLAAYAYTVTAWSSSSTITRYVGQPHTGTLTVTPGQQITIVVGAGGTNINPDPGTDGRAGAGGYAKVTVNGVSTQYTTPGTYTYTVPS